MGWTLSLVFFLKYTETARDLEKHYINAPVGTLPPHPMDRPTIISKVINHITDTNKWEKGYSYKFLKMIEYFVDNFINICHPKSE